MIKRKMKLEQRIKIMYENDKAKRIAEPILNELPITIRGFDGVETLIEASVGSSMFAFADQMPNSIHLYAKRMGNCGPLFGNIDCSGLEKLSSKRYRLRFHASSVAYLIITDKKRKVEIYLLSHSRDNY